MYRERMNGKMPTIENTPMAAPSSLPRKPRRSTATWPREKAAPNACLSFSVVGSS